MHTHTHTHTHTHMCVRKNLLVKTQSHCTLTQLNVAYKFGGSSVRDAERMREVADIICSFPHLLPVVILSAMGKVRTRLNNALP
jgi:hypothetical protein